MLEDTFYFDSILSIVSKINALKFGPFSYIKFHLVEDKEYSINMQTSFMPASKEIHFYSMALRQYDILAEILCYYRIFESISPGSHFSLLNECIQQIASYKINPLYIFNTQEPYGTNPQDVFVLIKKRAIKQIRKLNRSEIINIGEYLYKNERCEIAHGKKSNRVSDFGIDYFESYNNVFIMKLAARIAIENKLLEK